MPPLAARERHLGVGRHVPGASVRRRDVEGGERTSRRSRETRGEEEGWESVESGAGNKGRSADLIPRYFFPQLHPPRACFRLLLPSPTSSSRLRTRPRALGGHPSGQARRGGQPLPIPVSTSEWHDAAVQGPGPGRGGHARGSPCSTTAYASLTPTASPRRGGLGKALHHPRHWGSPRNNPLFKYRHDAFGLLPRAVSGPVYLRPRERPGTAERRRVATHRRAGRDTTDTAGVGAIHAVAHSAPLSELHFRYAPTEERCGS